MSNRKAGVGIGCAAFVAVPVLIVAPITGFLLLFGPNANASCNPEAGTVSSVTIEPASVPQNKIGNYGHEQLVNAAYVIQAGKDLGLGVRDQTIGVMTAMGESGLRVIDYGDAAGPDSRGLFQQRANGAWGSYADRMNPYISATNYFKALMKVQDRESLEPTIIAHRTQRNADPNHYTRYWDSAVAVVEGLSGIDTGLATGTGNQVCASTGTTPGQVSTTGWAVPAKGPITSPFGYRIHPITGVRKLHAGTDLSGGGCEGPIWAAQSGVVTFVGFDSGGNGTMTIDHGGGVQTKYLHEYASGMLVSEGQQVKAGDQIGRVGSSGGSIGCHLHFSVYLNNKPVDPVPFMQGLGITLGS